MTIPSTDTEKEVLLQAANLAHDGAGDRHVLTGSDSSLGTTVAQIIQLTGQSRNYTYYSSLAQSDLMS